MEDTTAKTDIIGSSHNGGIAFDASSGIPEAEQREILAGINRIAEMNRSALSEGGLSSASGGEKTFASKKKGVLFPVLVNALAVIILGGGFSLLFLLQGKTDTEIREGKRVYNSAERALIDEIRKESSARVSAKEAEISVIVSKLAGVDAELRELYSENQELSAEQLASEASLQKLQEEYRSGLLILQNERSELLEDFRSREANLRAQLETRGRELSALTEKSREELNSARAELERLTGEQEKTAVIESQIAALFSRADTEIKNGLYTEAADTVSLLRGYIDTPSFQGIRAIQARREAYGAAINSIAAAIEYGQKNSAGGAPGGARTEEAMQSLQSKNDKLAADIAELKKTMNAFRSEGSEAERRMAEIQETLSNLETEKNALEEKAAEQDLAIMGLEEKNRELAGAVDSLEGDKVNLTEQNTALNGAIKEYETQLEAVRQLLAPSE